MTLIETMVALVVTLLVAVPALGFVALAGARQAQALVVNTETGQVGQVDTQFLRDMTGSKAAVSQLNSDNSSRDMSKIERCSGSAAATADPVFALVNGSSRRVVYELADSSLGSAGLDLWRTECDNNGVPGTDPFSDPLLQGGSGDPTESVLLARRVGSVATSCPAATAGDDQAAGCETGSMTVVAHNRENIGSTSSSQRLGVQFEATRRSNGYAAPDTPPFANFYYQPNQPERTAPVEFDASGSRDRRGSSLVYQWDFGDGTPPAAFSSSPTTTHSFSTASVGGPFTVTLTVRNLTNITAEATKDIVVIPKKPVATVLSALPLEAVKGVPFELKYELETFDFPLAAGEIDWDADSEVELGSPVADVCPVGGNGCVSSRTYSFQETGDKRVRLMVRDGSGATATRTVVVRVFPEAYYVRLAASGGVDDADCGPVTDPCATIPFGSSRALSDKRTHVFVAGGSYPALSPLSGLTIQGGWDQNFTDPDGGVTTINGNSGADVPYSVYIQAGRNDITLANLKIASPTLGNGSNRSSQGIMVGKEDGNPGNDSLTDNIVFSDIEVSGGRGKNPAGILVNKGNVTMSDSTISSPASDQSASAAGSSNYGVRVVNGSGIQISDSRISAQNAVNGADGNQGSLGGQGQPGPNTDGRGGADGGAGGGASGANGGKGGNGGDAYCSFLCFDWGKPGLKGADGFGGTSGGAQVGRDTGGKGGGGGNGPNVGTAASAPGGNAGGTSA
ncbi:MAG: PKD domain-containing protein, partial [Candidatus Microthrix sp.]|nr:PKD domain-containing protein [Candidatus Microthrix sp.]